MQTFYKEIIQSKTGISIPVLQNGKTLDSIYNPENDAIRKFNAIPAIKEKIILIYGLGSALFVSKILENYNDIKILCVEYSAEDISLLLKIPQVQKIKNNIILFPKEELFQTLITQYIPSLYGDLKIFELNGYLSDNIEYSNYLKKQTQDALMAISKDYSVQSHFGKIWQHNISNNINIFINLLPVIQNPDIQKTCFVLGAGPGLEDCIQELLAQKDDYFVIATDTAFSVMKANHIHCDMVVTLDAQNVSINHFIHHFDKETLFITDLSSSPSISKKILKNGNNLTFFSSGHPLSNLYFGKNFSTNSLFSGSGTVTIAALDYAIKKGFKTIKVWGADFSFPKNKPYSKGTYLDKLYNKNANRISSSEKAFSALMYRTELFKNDKGNLTTQVLDSYRTSFEKYLDQYSKNDHILWKKEQNVYVIEKKHENIYKDFLNSKTDYSDFFEKIRNRTPASQELELACLPYIAFLRRKNPDQTYDQYLKEAYELIRRNFKV